MMQTTGDDVTTRALPDLLAPLLGLPMASGALDEATWRALAARAARERLAPLLYAAVQQNGGADIPPDVLATLAQAHCRSAAAVLYQQQELAAILRHCASAQIPCIVLKGSALAATLYPDPALRPCGDIDLLFRPNDISCVLELLQQRGFAAPSTADLNAAAAGVVGEYHLTRRGALPAIVEPHWRLTNSPYYARRLAADDFWQQTMPTNIGGVSTQVLAPAAQFVHLAVHFYLHHDGSQLLWLFDLALLLAQDEQPWEWAKLGCQAQRLGVLRCVRQAIQDIRGLWDLPAASRAWQALASLRPDLTERAEWWLQASPDSPLWAMWRLWHDPRGRLYGIAQAVAPSTDVLVRHYGLGHGCKYTRWQILRAHWRRCCRLPARVVQAGRELTILVRDGARAGSTRADP